MQKTWGIGVLIGGCLGLGVTLLSGPAQARDLEDEYALESFTGNPQAPIRIPEGVAFDPFRGDFFATGIFGGRITRVDGRTGEETTLYRETDNPTMGFGGIKVAPVRRVAWVCAVDVATLSSLPVSYVYAIRVPEHGEGELLRKFELPVPFFCNDLALDLQGNVYFTNSVGTAVMKISPRALWDESQGAEVFAQSGLLTPTFVDGVPQLAANGIAVTPDNRYLIVDRDAPAGLVRISLADPTEVLPITFTGDAFAQDPEGTPLLDKPDGLIFARGKLYVIYLRGVQQLTFASDGDYLQADVSTTTSVPLGLSTAANAYGEVYAIQSDVQALYPELGLPIELPHRIVHIESDLF